MLIVYREATATPEMLRGNLSEVPLIFVRKSVISLPMTNNQNRVYSSHPRI